MLNTTVRACIDRSAETHGNSPFLLAPESTLILDYAGLRRECLEFEAALTAIGLKPGDKVAFLLDNGHWTASLLLGTMYAGMVTVPLNAVAGQRAVRYVLEHCDATVLFCSQKYRTEFGDAIDTCSRAFTVIETDEETGPRWARLTPRTHLDGSVEPSDDALLLYTSGTTGLPKGVRLSHRAVVTGGHNTAMAHALTRSVLPVPVGPLNMTCGWRSSFP
mgnify:CR=1 FL=1